MKLHPTDLPQSSSAGSSDSLHVYCTHSIAHTSGLLIVVGKKNPRDASSCSPATAILEIKQGSQQASKQASLRERASERASDDDDGDNNGDDGDAATNQSKQTAGWALFPTLSFIGNAKQKAGAFLFPIHVKALRTYRELTHWELNAQDWERAGQDWLCELLLLVNVEGT
jgi:hypothetical protein